MRKILIIFLIALFSSCYVYQSELEHQEESTLLDFSEYAKKDFHFTTDIYRGKYISYGYITIEISPKVTYQGRSKKNDFIGENYIKHGMWYVEKIDVEDLLRQIYQKATKLGANAIVELDIKTITHSLYHENSRNMFDPELKILAKGIKISGLAIKRLD